MMRKNLLMSAAILIAVSSQAFAGGAPGGVLHEQGRSSSAAAPASGAPSAVEVPQTSAPENEKQPGASGEAKLDAGAAGAASAQAAQQRAVFGSGCFGFFGSRTFSLVSRGTVLYRVVPTTYFDVKLRVTYVGLRTFNRDRYTAPGAESIAIKGPSVWWPVKVTISGYNGQRGCFNLFAG